MSDDKQPICHSAEDFGRDPVDNALLEQKLVERIAELPKRWRKRAERVVDGFGSSGGVGTAVFNECADELEKTMQSCVHPRTLTVRPTQGSAEPQMVAWCYDCGAARMYENGIDEWRFPESYPTVLTDERVD